MKIRLILFFFLMNLTFALQAQDYYSYISDRKFKDPTDLVGYDFRPNEMDLRADGKKTLKPGEYSFGVTTNNLYVNGKGIKGVYSINNINSTDYGYKLLLMNARDPTIQGHLKIVLNNRDQVDALVFKRSVKEKEILFFQAQISESLRDKEDKYFTGKWEEVVETKDSVWGNVIRPFMQIHLDQNVQERLQPSDSMSIEFIETITVIDKSKKKGKKEKEEKEEEEEVVVTKVITKPVEKEEEKVVAAPEPEEAEPQGEVSAYERRFKRYSRKPKKEEPKEEEPKEEVVEEKTIEVEEVVAEVSTEDEYDPVIDGPKAYDQVEKKKKIKVVKEYFVKIRSILTYDDGTSEDKIWMHPVKRIIEKERKETHSDPKINEAKYRIEFVLKKGGSFYLYLTEKRTVCFFESNDKEYLMKGY